MGCKAPYVEGPRLFHAVDYVKTIKVRSLLHLEPGLKALGLSA